MIHSSGGAGPNISGLSGTYDRESSNYLRAGRALPESMMKVVLDKFSPQTMTAGDSKKFKYTMPHMEFHNGGAVGYAKGGEVAAMLQGGEVVVPMNTVDKVNPMLDALTSGKMGLGEITNNITINGANHSPQVIAKMVVGEIEKSMKRTVNIGRVR
jgi:hypothetical protein